MIGSSETAEIGIFGGSGFYSFAESDIREIKMDTPYGPPSDEIALTTIGGRSVAFLPRHGRAHTLPPHKVPYMANLWAFKQLGIQRVIAPAAVGSLQPNIKPGDFVIIDQFIDRTNNRRDTYFDGPNTTHISAANPYCSELRRIAREASDSQGVPVHYAGTCVVIQGPRFSTKAESRWFTQMGWDVINMTQYPEVVLARELEMCYVNLSLVTDYDAGVVASEGPVQAVNVGAILKQNTDNVKNVIKRMIDSIPASRDCECGSALKYAQL